MASVLVVVLVRTEVEAEEGEADGVRGSLVAGKKGYETLAVCDPGFGVSGVDGGGPGLPVGVGMSSSSRPSSMEGNRGRVLWNVLGCSVDKNLSSYMNSKHEAYCEVSVATYHLVHMLREALPPLHDLSPQDAMCITRCTRWAFRSSMVSRVGCFPLLPPQNLQPRNAYLKHVADLVHGERDGASFV